MSYVDHQVQHQQHSGASALAHQVPGGDGHRCRIWLLIYPLVMTNITMEHGPFIDGLPIKNGDFPCLC